jgi:hypothetical protein
MRNFNLLLLVTLLIVVATLVAAWQFLGAVDALEASYVLRGIDAQEATAKVVALNGEGKQTRSWERAGHKGAHVRTAAGWVHVTYIGNGATVTTHSDGSAVTSWGTQYPAARRKGDYTFF